MTAIKVLLGLILVVLAYALVLRPQQEESKAKHAEWAECIASGLEAEFCDR